MKNCLLFIGLSCLLQTLQAQPVKGGPSAFSFIEYQRNFPRPAEALQRKEDTLRKQFAEKKIPWPARYLYIRSFKYDSQLEVWVKNRIGDPFQLFKTYRVCALAGSLGPKRMEGDYQVPEGFYYINEFNPKSNYYLSLGINYPNASDKVLSDSLRPGSAIYIHGSCVTVGCIPITDQQIDELYILAAHAKDQGQDYIPVHIFPIRFDKEKSVNYLASLTKDDPVLRQFAARMEEAFDYFEAKHQLPVVMIGNKGEYLINEAGTRKPKPAEAAKPVVVKKAPVVHRTRQLNLASDAVHQWPQFPGGADAFMQFLEKTGQELGRELPAGMKKAFVQLEFVVDSDGVPVNFRILKGIPKAEELMDELITRLEKMPNWKPALLHEKPVAKKMVQTVTLVAPE